MMNSLPAGFYLPVFVTEDPSKKLFFLSPEHEDSVKEAYSYFEELKKLSPIYKVNTFMTSKDTRLTANGMAEIRALVSVPREEKYFTDQKVYDKWLEEKVILRTERFFPGRPVWNIASTRHALLGNYQFKGIGFTGITGRCDYPHTHGNLDIYLALFETVMSWHFNKTPMKTQKVVALWKDDHRTNPKILMLREANSFRLAQVMGINLEEEEKRIIFKSLNIEHESDLQEKYFDVIRNYAWFIAHSYEYTSPTFDNLMLDGSLIDCSSILHYNSQGWTVPFHLEKNFDETWKLHFGLEGEVLTLLAYTHRAYKNLGLDMDFTVAVEYFWSELSKLVGASAQKIMSFFRDNRTNRSESLKDWENFLGASFPEADIRFISTEQSRFYQGPIEEGKVTILVSFPNGPEVKFSPYEVTDRILQYLNASRNIPPREFAEAVLRSTQS